jgi:putative Mg2+ transporter-C (MgtC) family protein
MLVAVGSALFVIGPMQSGMPLGEWSRVIQGIIQGIGFLEAGAIMVLAKQQLVEGLTKAASIWATAGIGIIAGLGLESTAVVSTVVVLVILAAIPACFRCLPPHRLATDNARPNEQRTDLDSRS